jgi:hypothetical protein
MRTISSSRKKFWIAPVVVAALALFSAVTMLLWNALMPQIFHLPTINYWQAIGLLILARLFFGGGLMHRSHRSHDPRWNHKIKDKFAGMTPEEREEFFKKLHKFRHFVHYYDFGGKETGKDSKEEQSNE